MILQPLLTELEAAERLGIDVRYLAHLRRHRQGPPCIHLTARTFRYNSEELAHWMVIHNPMPAVKKSA